MPSIDLKYGRSTIPFSYDEDRFKILGVSEQAAPLTDIELGKKLDRPVGSETIEEIIHAGETVLIVVPDATRQTASGQVVNLLVRRLIANGTMPFEIAIIFATGIHRPVTEAEKQAILTPFIAQRVKTLAHGPRDLMQIIRLGETSGGIAIELNRALTEYDHIVLVGGVTFHYFAGFTGGRKLICPGLASSKTVSATHKLAFDCERRGRAAGVGPGRLDGNPVHEAFMEAVGKTRVSFAVSTIVNDSGDAVDLFCGDWVLSHRAACEKYAADHTIPIPEKRELVIASCGGFPHDINMIQAHKTLETASQACADGGTIILLAECADGLGRADFLNWFDAANSAELAEKLCAAYQVNGQTAWTLLQKAERFHIRIVTALGDEDCKKMRLDRVDSIEGALSDISGNSIGYILPFGAKFLVETLRKD
jgi:nickel-dependent lactate racemase